MIDITKLDKKLSLLESGLQCLSAGEVTGELIASLLLAISGMYSVLSRAAEDIIAQDSDTDVFAEVDAQVEAWISDGSIIVRTPPLASRFSRTSRGTAGMYSRVFAAETRRAMMRLDLSTDGFHSFEEIHIAVIGVYPESARSIPDADNIDTKAIIDAITMFFPHGDDAEHCTISLTNMKDSTMSKGTYFVVSPGQSDSIVQAVNTIRKVMIEK